MNDLPAVANFHSGLQGPEMCTHLCIIKCLKWDYCRGYRQRFWTSASDRRHLQGF